MKRSLRCGGIAMACVAVAMVLGGCPNGGTNTDTNTDNNGTGKSSFAAAPVLNPPGGYYPDPVAVQISSTTDGATVYYTTDLSTPSDTNGQEYTGAINVNHTMTIKAIAYADGVSPSLSISAVYTIGGNQPPVVTSASVTGTLTAKAFGSVTVTCDTEDADGYVDSVFADLSSLGADNHQALTQQQGSSVWSWTGRVQPPSTGTFTIPIMVTDNRQAVTTVERTITVTVMAGEQEWTATTDGMIRGSAAVAPDGTIYIGSTDRYLYAFLPDGSPKWTFNAAATIAGTPAVASDGTIYVGGGSLMFAVTPEGQQKWRFSANGPIASSPAIGARGIVYFGAGDGDLYALDPATGAQKWAVPLSLSVPAPAIQSSPAIGSDGTIYIGADDGNLYARYPDGTSKWTFMTTAGSPVVSSPAIDADGTVYVGSSDGNLYAINPDGSQKWVAHRTSPVTSSPAIGPNGVIYVGCQGGSLAAIDPVSGNLLWSYASQRAVNSSPAVASDGTVYFGSEDHEFYALSQKGSLLWAFNATQAIDSSPLLSADGTIFIGSDDRKFYALHAGTTLANSSWPLMHGNLQRTGAVAGLPANNLLPVVVSKDITFDKAPLVGRASTFTVTTSVKDFDGTIQSVTVDLTALGGTSTQAMTSSGPGTYQWSGSLTPPTYGTKTITLKVKDNDGGVQTATLSLNVSAIPTITSATVSGSFSWGRATNTTVTCVAADPSDPAPTVTVDLSPLGGQTTQALAGTNGAYTWTGSLTPAAVGAKTITFTVKNSGGQVMTRDVAVTVADVPLISGASSSGVLYKGNASTLTVACTVTNVDGTIDHVTADLQAFGKSGSAPLSRVGNQWTWSDMVTPPNSGTFTINITAYDTRGAYSIVPVSAPVVLDPPTFKTMNITQPIVRGQAATIAVQCTVIGVAPITVEADLRPIGGIQTQVLTPGANNSYSWSQQLTPPATGATQIVFTANDKNGIVSHATLDFAFQSPTLTVSNPVVTGSLSELVSGNVSVSCTVTGTPTGPVTVDLSDLGGPASTALTFDGVSTWSNNSIQVSQPIAGVHTAVFTATDAGNNTASATKTVQVNPSMAWAPYDSGMSCNSSPAIASDGTVYVGFYNAGSGKLTALTAGALKWEYALGGETHSSPAIAKNGDVYIGCDDNKVYAIRSTGAPSWPTPFATTGKVTATPAVGDSKVYVGSWDKNIYAINSTTGAEAWHYTTGDAVVSSAALSDDNVLYVGSLDKKLYAIDRNSVSNPPALKWPAFTAHGAIYASPALGSTAVYFADLAGYVYCLNRLTGQDNWNLAAPIGGAFHSSPAIGPDGTVYIGSDDGKVYAINGANGSVKWTFATGGAVQSSPAIDSNGTIYVGSAGKGLYAISSSGTQKWLLAGTSADSCPAIGLNRWIYMVLDGKVNAVQGSYSLAGSLWPMFQRNALHTGRIDP